MLCNLYTYRTLQSVSVILCNLYILEMCVAEIFLDVRNILLGTATYCKHLATWQALTKLTIPAHNGLHSNWLSLTLKIHKINLMRIFTHATNMH